jgi:hypothetical protein
MAVAMIVASTAAMKLAAMQAPRISGRRGIRRSDVTTASESDMDK